MGWIDDDKYTSSVPIPDDFRGRTGPNKMALLDVYGEGRTTAGWGLLPKDGKPGFMQNYERGVFWPTPRIKGLQHREKPFAIVMRSVQMIAVDLDRGHESGDDGVKTLERFFGGNVPPTLTETSKSGLGRHLFYLVPNDIWDPGIGFGRYDDAISLLKGVDIRAVGCVYHYPTQRWNSRPVATIPPELEELLEIRRANKIAHHNALAAAAAAPDDEDSIIMHDNLLQELNKPITSGSRNNTLFGIGSKMHEAGVPDWETQVERRGIEVGLDATEVAKIISNIQNYG